MCFSAEPIYRTQLYAKSKGYSVIFTATHAVNSKFKKVNSDKKRKQVYLCSLIKVQSFGKERFLLV